MATFRSGRWQQAEQLYREVIEREPGQFDAWHLLGMIAGQTGRDTLAIECLNSALRLKPGFAAAHNNPGNVLVGQRRLADAVASFRRAVHLQPDFALAYNCSGGRGGSTRPWRAINTPCGSGPATSTLI